LGKSHYVLMAGYPLFAANASDPGGRFAGIFNYNQPTKITTITDGTSNTIMIGEYSNAYVDFGTGNSLTGPCGMAWAGGAMLYTFWDKGPVASDLTGYPNIPRRYSPWFRLSSPHTGIINVAMGDGSVSSLRTSVSYDVFVALGGMGDGVTVNSN
jgi:hypothetical protein